MKMRSRWGVFLLMAAFALQGSFFSLALPYGDPLDEIFHFGYAVFLETTGRSPRVAEPSMPEELLAPLGLLPRSTSFPGPRVSFREAARLPKEELNRRWYEAFPSAPRTLRFVTTNYESQQPPLFYLAAASGLRFLSTLPFDRRLLALRLAATLLAMLAVPLAHSFFRRLLSRRAALAATAAFVAFPGIGVFVGRFTNDALALPIVVGLLLLFAEAARGRLSTSRATALLLLLALGCWTKLYVLLLLPAAPLAALLAPPRSRRIMVLRSSVASSAALLSFLPWLVRQRADTGDWLGMLASRQAGRLGLSVLDRLGALTDILHVRFAVVFARTFLWPGTWSAMGAPPAVAVVLLGVLALVILLPLALRGRSPLRRRVWRGSAVVLPLFAVGYAAYASTYAAVGRLRGHSPSAGPDGWYLLVLLPVLLTAGCVRGQRVAFKLFLLAVGVFVAAGGLLILGTLPALYAGQTAPNGSNASLRAWAPMAGAPAVALQTYARLGLARVPAPLLGGILAAALLAFLAALLAPLRHSRPLGP